jgi:hypothetical protein
MQKMALEVDESEFPGWREADVGISRLEKSRKNRSVKQDGHVV